MSPKNLITFLPAVTSFAFLIAIFYDAGEFVVIGPIWMSSLSVQDMFALSWTALLYFWVTLIPFVIQFLQSRRMPSVTFTKDRHFLRNSVEVNIAYFLAITFSSLPIILFVSLSNVGSVRSDEDSQLRTSSEIIPYLGVITLFLFEPLFHFWQGPNASAIAKWGLYVVFCATTLYAFGFDASMKHIEGSSCSVVYLKDGTAKWGRLLLSAERGLILTRRVDIGRIFISRDEFKTIEDGYMCR